MKSWLQGNNIEMYSTHNEEKSVVAGRFIIITAVAVLNGNSHRKY